MKKRIAIILTTALMILSILPVQVFAGAEESFTTDRNDLVQNEEAAEIATPFEDMQGGENLELRDEVQGKESAQNEAASGQEEEASLSGSCGESLTWELSPDGEGEYVLTISGTGDMTDYTPYAQYPSQAPWFADPERMISTIVVNEGVTSIGTYAFSDLGADRLSLSDTLTRIGAYSFQGCNFSEITIPGSVKTIGENAFSNCHVKKLTLEEGIVTIERSAFQENDLESVVFPEGLETLGTSSFYRGQNLTTISLPSSIKKIAYAFSGWTETVFYRGTKEEWDQVEGSNDSVFDDCKIYFGRYGVLLNKEAISLFTDESFQLSAEPYGDLSDATLSWRSSDSNVASVDENGLVTVHKAGTALITVTAGTSPQASEVCTVTAEDRILSGSCGEGVTWKLDREGTLTISGQGRMGGNPNSTTCAMGWAENTDRIRQVIIEDGVTYIGSYAFANCYNIESVSIPLSVLSAGSDVFGYIDPEREYERHIYYAGCEIEQKERIGSHSVSGPINWHYAYHAIVYNLDGGSIGGETKYIFTELTGTYVLPIPVKSGYQFEGWYDSKTSTYDYTNMQYVYDWGNKVTEVPAGTDIKLYARWTEQQNVPFDAIIINPELPVAMPGDAYQITLFHYAPGKGTPEVTYYTTDENYRQYPLTTAHGLTFASDGTIRGTVDDSGESKFSFGSCITWKDGEGNVIAYRDMGMLTLFFAGKDAKIYQVPKNVEKAVLNREYFLQPGEEKWLSFVAPYSYTSLMISSHMDYSDPAMEIAFMGADGRNIPRGGIGFGNDGTYASYTTTPGKEYFVYVKNQKETEYRYAISLSGHVSDDSYFDEVPDLKQRNVRRTFEGEANTIWDVYTIDIGEYLWKDAVGYCRYGCNYYYLGLDLIAPFSAYYADPDVTTNYGTVSYIAYNSLLGAEDRKIELKEGEKHNKTTVTVYSIDYDYVEQRTTRLKIDLYVPAGSVLSLGEDGYLCGKQGEVKADGLYDLDGEFKYYENGVFIAATGMVKRPDNNKWYYVENGVFTKKTGMVKRIDDGKWFYVENGVFNNKATGVVKRISDGKLFYVAKGKYDNKFTGAAMDLSKKNTYYVTKGQVKAVTDVFKVGNKWKYFVKGKFTASTGVVARSKDKKWVYINKGVVTASTGMAKRLTDNKWVYVEKGVLSTKTGLVQRISDKKWFYVQKGVYNNKYTGGVQRISDKKWFYVAKGQLNKATGIAKCTDGKYRYFKNGSFNKLTGKAKLIGTNKVYKVKNGILVK